MSQIPIQVWIAVILIGYSGMVLYLILAAKAWKDKTLDLQYLILEADHYCGTCLETWEMFTTAEDHFPPALLPSAKNMNENPARWISDHEYLPCFLVVVPGMVEQTGRTVTSDDLDKDVLVSKEVTRRRNDVR